MSDGDAEHVGYRCETVASIEVLLIDQQGLTLGTMQEKATEIESWVRWL